MKKSTKQVISGVGVGAILGLVAILWNAKHESEMTSSVSRGSPLQAKAENASTPRISSIFDTVASVKDRRNDMPGLLKKVMSAYPTLSVQDAYQFLAERARAGDATASYESWVLASACTTGIKALSNSLNDMNRSDAEFASLHDYVQNLNQDCGTVASVADATRRQLIATAAEAKIPEASLGFYSEGPPGGSDSPLNSAETIAWDKQAIDYLRMAAGQGDRSALVVLAGIYQSGTELTPANPELALAYNMAELQALTNAQNIAPGVIARAARTVEAGGKNLSPAQVAAARSEASSRLKGVN